MGEWWVSIWVKALREFYLSNPDLKSRVIVHAMDDLSSIELFINFKLYPPVELFVFVGNFLGDGLRAAIADGGDSL